MLPNNEATNVSINIYIKLYSYFATKTPTAGIKIDDANPGKFNCSKNKSKNITVVPYFNIY